MEKTEFFNQKQRSLKSALMEEIAGMTSSLVLYMLKRKDVLVDGVRQSKDISLFGGEKIVCYYDSKQLKPKFEIAFEDNNILIINKFAGIEVCDGVDNVEKMLNADGIKCWAVHRIDRNTEGLVLFAKNQTSKDILEKAIKDKSQIKKTYVCEVVGSPKFEHIVDEKYLVKDAKKSVVKIYPKEIAGAYRIVTEFEVVKRLENSTILKAILFTGRTHQIRAHLSSLGCPIVGDGKYGDYEANRKLRAKTQHLTAARIDFCLKDENLSYLNDRHFEVKPTWLH